MTFAELAAARGISKESAIRLVRRRRWRRQKDNTGHIRAYVPEAWASGKEDSPADAPPDNPSDTTRDISRAISALEAAVSTLREQLTRESTRADQAEAKLRAAEAELSRMREQAEAAKSESDADLPTRRRGRLARLLMAWRGKG